MSNPFSYFYMVYNVREVIRILEKDGWYLVRQRGSHRQYRHATKPGLATVSGHKMNDDVPVCLLRSIESQAGIQFPRR